MMSRSSTDRGCPNKCCSCQRPLARIFCLGEKLPNQPLVLCNSNNYSAFRPEDCINGPKTVGFAGGVLDPMLNLFEVHDTSSFISTMR